jgi:hypothetical protein
MHLVEAAMAVAAVMPDAAGAPRMVEAAQIEVVEDKVNEEFNGVE